MAKQSQTVEKAPCEPCERKRAQFKKRICVRLDDDVIALGNAVLSRVAFKDLSHACNAAIRQAFTPLKPEEIVVPVYPFEQLVFAKRVRVVRESRKGKGRK